MYSQSKDIVRSFIAQYQQKIFALALYLAGQNQDIAYDICASSFVEAIQDKSSLEQKEVLIVELIGIAVEKCRTVKTIPVLDVIQLLEISGAEKGQLLIVLKALQTLDFEQKVPLLLRYQCNLPYGDIATVLLVSKSDARIKIAQARVQLEQEIKRIVSKA